jgi:hypothetical protein
MYATIHPFTPPADARSVLGDGAVPVGSVVLASSDGAGDGDGGTLLALWPDAESAGRTGAERVYRVDDVMRGTAAGRRPMFAQVTWINGTGDRARADAAEHGGRHRIWPAVREIDGIVEVLALRSDDHRVVVVGLATGRETHQAVQRTVLATPLLPDEDPALMTGADRIDLVRVVSADLPTAVGS